MEILIYIAVWFVGIYPMAKLLYALHNSDKRNILLAAMLWPVLIPIAATLTIVDWVALKLDSLANRIL